MSMTQEDQLRAMLVRCTQDLAGLGSDVVKVFTSKERDFLDLGRDLEGFAGQAQAVAESAMELARHASSQAVHEAIQRLSDYLDGLREIFGQVGQEQSLAELAAIADIETHLVRAVGDFGKLVKHLSMLGIATRIESARLGSEGLGFSTLADDVETLAGKIDKSVADILVRCQSLGSFTSATKARAASIQELQKSLSQTISGTLQAGVKQLNGLADDSQAVIESLAERAHDVYARVSQTVISLQFHDIIRQQLEHTAESMEEVRRMAAEPGTQEPLEIITWIYDVLRLQSSQMENAKVRFNQAMDELRDNLTGIGREVEDMARDLAGLSQRQGSGEDGPLATVEKGIGQVTQTVNEYQDLSRGLVEVMAGVAEAIQGMSGSVAEIEEVGSEIELIAINASIKAARTGDIGAALGVLASAIQKLSVEARSQTDTVTGILDKIGQSSKALSQNTENSAGAEQLQNITAGLKELLGKLRGMNNQMSGQLASVKQSGQSLGQAIGQAASSIIFPVDIISVLQSNQTRLTDLVQSLAPVVPRDRRVVHSQRLREMMQRYTMEAERLVHLSLSGDAPLASSAGPEPGAAGDGLGDNVELF